jgi:iron complex transport system substrate-binding protein
MLISRLAVAAVGFALSASTALGGSTAYPISVTNCGFTFEFKKAPQNVVSIGQGATEILYALGAGDNMAGTALWFAKVLPEYEAANANVARIADNAPSFEAVIGKKPGLVTTQFEWMIGKQGVVGTREQFRDLNVPTYIMPDDCEGKDNLVGADGTRKGVYTPDFLYKGIGQLAEIFDRQDKGANLIADLKARQKKAAEQAKALDLKGASAVFWFSSADLDLDPYVAGKLGPSAYIMKTIGLKNVIESAEEWPTVGWETIAKANPTYVVIARMDRRRFPADDFQKKLEYLKTDPVTSQMDAVKNGRILIVDADAMQSSLRMVQGMEKLVKDLAERKK